MYKVKRALLALQPPHVGGEVYARAKVYAEYKILKGWVTIPDIDGDDFGLWVSLSHFNSPDAGPISNVEDAKSAGSEVRNM